MNLESLKPARQQRVMDLVAETGADVSDWANCKGGEQRAASNPKYCYDWSYEDQEQELIIFNVWYENLKKENNQIIQIKNYRDVAKACTSSPQVSRANKMDSLLQKAARVNSPVRVIICDGTRHENSNRSNANKRHLDNEWWHVNEYDSSNGNCKLVRDKSNIEYIDQFNEELVPALLPNKKGIVAQVYERSAKVRQAALKRAGGNCEWCGKKGFLTSAGSIFLETHHIHPLSEKGEDSIYNVIALCPNHHREAHYGADHGNIKKHLHAIIKA